MLRIICFSFSYLGSSGLVNVNGVVVVQFWVPEQPMFVSVVKVVSVVLSFVACAIRVYWRVCVQLKVALSGVLARTGRFGSFQVEYLCYVALVWYC